MLPIKEFSRFGRNAVDALDHFQYLAVGLMAYNENRTQTCRSEEDVRALASTAPERRHVHPARVNNLVMRDPATVHNPIY